jgi:hypothetical protein
MQCICYFLHFYQNQWTFHLISQIKCHLFPFSTLNPFLLCVWMSTKQPLVRFYLLMHPGIWLFFDG